MEKMKKKIFSLVLGLILCFASFSAYAAEMVNESAYLQTNSVNAGQLAANYSGTWWDLNSQRCYMEITPYNDVIFVTVSWGNGVAETFEWTMAALYNPATGKFHYNNCTSKLLTSDAYGNNAEIVYYVNGTGAIYIASNGYLYWEDDVEQIGAGCYFEKEIVPNWIGTYISEDNQVINISAYNDAGVLMTYTGYAEEGWYTWTKLLPYWYGSKDYVGDDEHINNRMVFTIYDTGINVDVLPAGGWAEGFYYRQ